MIQVMVMFRYCLIHGLYIKSTFQAARMHVGGWLWLVVVIPLSSWSTAFLECTCEKHFTCYLLTSECNLSDFFPISMTTGKTCHILWTGSYVCERMSPISSLDAWRRFWNLYIYICRPSSLGDFPGWLISGPSFNTSRCVSVSVRVLADSNLSMFQFWP